MAAKRKPAPPDGAPDTVTIGGQTVRLVLPDSHAVRYELVGAGDANPFRAVAACLGVCWQGKGHPGGKYADSGFNPLVYGGKVIDELCGERRIGPDEVSAAGAVAYRLIRDSLISGAEVAAAEDFSEAAGAPST
jgi:hypothetical protein